MAWIKTIRPEEGDDRLREAVVAQHALYPEEYATPVEALDAAHPGIVASHSLIPEALHHAFATFGALMAPELPLSRKQHELIATVVSLTNRCRYCTESHAEFLRRATLDDDLVRALRESPSTAQVSEQDRAMLEYASTLTLDATLITPAHHERLRAVGFDDRAILQITLIAAWFNYINRVANALGVGREDEPPMSPSAFPEELAR